ncbi:WYL domain-containing protein [Nocardioides sp. SYSU DS0651]|uniref:WYL domain-containing protein n=1 Tax=Nocardioides sp. SYSU DS0651 TaxID=3415955 RepID=UPI003F4B5C08
MAKAPGRDQRGPMERLVRIAAVLRAKSELGVEGDRLAELAGFTGEDRADQLNRELRHLRRQGWQIDNVAPPGAPAVYRMTTVDNRLRVRLTPAQQAALRRAVLLADRGDLVARLGLPASARPTEVEAEVPTAVAAARDEALSLVVRAVRDRCLLTFGYKGTQREVHPESLRTQNGKWYLRGIETADLVPDRPAEATVKRFVVGRMTAPEAGPPGSAHPVPQVRHTGLHPMTWQLDPPVAVTLHTTADFEPDVRRWLGDPVTVAPVRGSGGEEVLLRYEVTNRSALRARLNELGRRVRIVGPEEVRAEVVAELARAARVGDGGGAS